MYLGSLGKIPLYLVLHFPFQETLSDSVLHELPVIHYVACIRVFKRWTRKKSNQKTK